MTRKVITIEFSKCPYFKRPISDLMHRMDFEGKIIPTSEGVCGIKGDVNYFIFVLLSEDREAGIEMFGSKFNYDSEVKKQIDYLKDLVNNS